MAKPTPQAITRTHSEISEAMMRYVLESWHDEREKLEALAIALERCLTPDDPSDPQEGDNIHAWRLSGVLADLLSSTTEFSALKKMALPDSQEVMPC